MLSTDNLVKSEDSKYDETALFPNSISGSVDRQASILDSIHKEKQVENIKEVIVDLKNG